MKKPMEPPVKHPAIVKAEKQTQQLHEAGKRFEKEGAANTAKLKASLAKKK